MPGPFIAHDTDTIPLDCNTVPLPECKVQPMLKDGKVIKVVDVEILSCASVWLRCQQEAERWISDANGKPLTDPMLINRRINSAYAFLWLADQRFQWAGLAAFASKQVGCGMLHAAETSGRMDKQIRAKSGGDSFEFVSSNLFELGTAAGSDHMRKQLALGNLTLFLDIYPLHRFYMLRGIKGIRQCLADREKIKDMVRWPEEAKQKLGYGKPFREILEGFERIESNDIEVSVGRLAYHEQVNVLQKVIYDNPVTQTFLDANQFAWVTGLPTGDYAEVQLTLSAQCSAKRGWTAWFPKSTNAHLWKAEERMKFVLRAAGEFHKLLQGKERTALHRSITQIYLGKGVA